MKSIHIIILFLSLSFTVAANNMAVSNLVLNQAAQEVTFDISWNNSWRFDGLAAPQNWDAAWVFVKFRGCGDCATSSDWVHGTVDGPNCNFGDLEAHSTDAGNQFYNDRLGVMLRRQTTGLFPNATATTVTLRVDNLPATGSIEMRVVGIEMVFVPEAAFELGDGSTNTSSRFHAGGAGNTTVYNVTSENAIVYDDTPGNLFSTGNGPCQFCFPFVPQNIPATFPKGFGAFYMMKYEISEGQYATFLNTITDGMAAIRYPGNYDNSRNKLQNNGTSPNIFYGERPDRAQNFLSPNDVMAYLDWSALRPMTEMEYEKAARGILPAVANEYAWGTTVVANANTINPAALEDGTETISNPANSNCVFNGSFYSGGDGSVTGNFNDQQGPLRVGIFADPFDATRQATGASYYGFMELSGNINELTISIADVENAPIFDGAFGDGYLGLSGNHNVPTWPTTVGGENKLMYRGGSWNSFGNNSIRTSNRQTATNSLGSRNSDRGGRGGR